MSTGFSCNLGYSMPKNWAFDQFCELNSFSSSPSFPLDKDCLLYTSLDDLTTRDQRMMFGILTMVHLADSKKQLDSEDVYKRQLKDSPTTRVLIHEKSSLAPPGQSLAFSLGDEKGFEWIGAYDITADELLTGTDTAKTESKTAQAQMLILELLANGKRMPSAELEKAVNERGISSRTMRTAKSRIGDRLVTEKDGTAWVCYLRD